MGQLPVGNTGLHPQLSQQMPMLGDPQGPLGPFGYIFLYVTFASQETESWVSY